MEDRFDRHILDLGFGLAKANWCEPLDMTAAVGDSRGGGQRLGYPRRELRGEGIDPGREDSVARKPVAPRLERHANPFDHRHFRFRMGKAGLEPGARQEIGFGQQLEPQHGIIVAVRISARHRIGNLARCPASANISGHPKRQLIGDQGPGNCRRQLAERPASGNQPRADLRVIGRILGRDENRPGDRIAPLGRSLRAPEDLDLLDIPQRRDAEHEFVEADRSTVDLQGDPRTSAAKECRQVLQYAGAILPADRRPAVARPQLDVGNLLQQLVQPVGARQRIEHLCGKNFDA